MSKPTPSLDGLIQTKGAARPDTMQQRGTATPPPAETPAPTPAPAAAQPRPTPAAPEPRAKSLTLRLSETQYQRLRRFAFDRGQSHQDVIERALMEHLDREGSQ